MNKVDKLGLSKQRWLNILTHHRHFQLTNTHLYLGFLWILHTDSYIYITQHRPTDFLTISPNN